MVPEYPEDGASIKGYGLVGLHLAGLSCLPKLQDLRIDVIYDRDLLSCFGCAGNISGSFMLGCSRLTTLKRLDSRLIMIGSSNLKEALQ